MEWAVVRANELDNQLAANDGPLNSKIDVAGSPVITVSVADIVVGEQDGFAEFVGSTVGSAMIGTRTVLTVSPGAKVKVSRRRSGPITRRAALGTFSRCAQGSAAPFSATPGRAGTP